MKRTVPLLVAAIVGWILVVAYFVPPLQKAEDEVTTWFNILAAAAVVLGAGNLLKVHLIAVSRREAGWGYSAVTLISFAVTIVVGLLKLGTTPQPQAPGVAWSGNYLEEGTPFWWIMEYLITPVITTMFSMLAFYVASAAFRAFRAKNVAATILLVTAIIVLLGRTYVGVLLTSKLPPDLQLNAVTDFIMSSFNTAGTRAIKIGIALGIVAASLKILLGMDRSYLGASGE